MKSSVLFSVVIAGLLLCTSNALAAPCTAAIRDRWEAAMNQHYKLPENRSRWSKAEICKYAATVPLMVLKAAQEYYPACNPSGVHLLLAEFQKNADGAVAFYKRNCGN